jgi:uncharacterized protein (DUF2235 family)
MTRRLIVCCDGTWNKLEQKDGGGYAPTNVAKIARSISPLGNGMEQVVFYDPGVGTGNALDRWTGGAMGVGLSDNVKDGYQFLMHNYTQHDEIYLFGFSRGAYTVRSLAGLIRKCGLLRKEHSGRIGEAYDIYRIRGDGADSDRADKFRDKYSWQPQPTPIKLIGVWDTVGALGVPGNLFRTIFGGKYRFHDVTLSSSVSFAYHALAIDEKRRSFKATLWEQSDKGRAAGQKLEQAWFPGVHSDVGGGYAAAGLSDEAFHWMSAKAAGAGLAFQQPLPVPQGNPLGRIHESWTRPYNLIPKFWRPIGEAPSGRESVHESALKRFRELDEYNPKNLAAYLDRSDASGTSPDAQPPR